MELNGQAWRTAFIAGVEWNALANLIVNFDPEISWHPRSLRFVDCTPTSAAECLGEQGERHYVFALLDSGYLSFTLRSTYTLSPRLSVQAYGQLFLARGHYHDAREIITEGRHPFIDRDDLGASTAPV